MPTVWNRQRKTMFPELGKQAENVTNGSLFLCLSGIMLSWDQKRPRNAMFLRQFQKKMTLLSDTWSFFHQDTFPKHHVSWMLRGSGNSIPPQIQKQWRIVKCPARFRNVSQLWQHRASLLTSGNTTETYHLPCRRTTQKHPWNSNPRHQFPKWFSELDASWPVPHRAQDASVIRCLLPAP